MSATAKSLLMWLALLWGAWYAYQKVAARKAVTGK